MSATTEFWVNDAQGMPLMMVIGQLTEKLQHAIVDLIIPQMMDAGLIKPLEEYSSDLPQCTLIFDREAYSPKFFDLLWEDYRISFISYRKNVTEKFPDESFINAPLELLGNKVDMLLCEVSTKLGTTWYREVRRKTDDGHQVAIITNHPTLRAEQIAVRMFARWSQENFFKYMISDFDFDKAISFGVEQVEANKLVVNPPYRKLSNQIKKTREKKQRLEAKFYQVIDRMMDQELEKLPGLTIKHEQYRTKIDDLNVELERLLNERKNHPAKIKVGQMPQETQYNQLKTESKKFINIIRMIAYRAETAVANLVCPLLENKNAENIKRMVVKQIINAPADIDPDYQNNTLTITLHHLSASRYNLAASKLAELLNESQTNFPGSNLKLIFKVSV